MTATWYGLLANLGVIALFLAVWSEGQSSIEAWPRNAQQVALGLLMGAGVVALMVLPFQLRQGIYIDLRSTLIALSGFLWGPIVGLIAGAAGLLFRAYLGGTGMTAGAFGIALSTTIGIAGHRLLRGRIPSRREVALLAACTAIGGIGGYFMLPRALWATTIPELAPPVVVMIFVATLITGVAIVNEMRRRETARSNRMYRSIIDALPDSLNAKDRDGRFLAANPATAELMHAASANALIGKSDIDFYPPEIAETFRADEVKVLAAGQPVTIEQKIVRDDGAVTWLATLKAPLHDRFGAIVGLLTHNRDISDRKRLEDAHAEAQTRLADALAYMADALVMFDRDERLVFCNEQYRTFFPRTAHLRVPGTPFRDILKVSLAIGEQAGVPVEEAEAWMDQTCASLHVPGESEIQLGDGRWLSTRVRPTGDGASLSLMTDVTSAKIAEMKLEELNDQLAGLARTDGLTGLTNRRGFDEALGREFARAARAKTPLSLLLVDVDRFKAFNDTYGHPAGDACLRSIGSALRQSFRRPADIATRYGGEEFAAVLPDTDPAGAFGLAEAFRLAVRNLHIPHGASEKGVVTVSVGIATFGWGGSIDRAEQLIDRADQALYGAKSSGRDRVHGGPPRPMGGTVTSAFA